MGDGMKLKQTDCAFKFTVIHELGAADVVALHEVLMKAVIAHEGMRNCICGSFSLTTQMGDVDDERTTTV